MKAAHAITAFRAFLQADRTRGIEILRMIEAAESRAGRTNVAEQLRRHRMCCPMHPPRIREHAIRTKIRDGR
jgi:hypothetical protein